jgi:transcription initiation factor TFIID subunit TAF12
LLLSQRNFRRRQENRVKFLESKTLELEANSRQLRAENERLKTELVHAHQRNDELFAMVSLPTTPVSAPLDMAYDRRQGPQAQQQQPQQQQQQSYSPSNMALPLSFDLNEEQFYVPPAVMQNSSRSAW